MTDQPAYPPHYHPHLDEHGRKVHLSKPSRASNLAQLAQPHTTVTFTPGPVEEQSLHGMALASWRPVDSGASVWEALATPVVAEPDYLLPAGMRAAAGAVVVEPDGRVWLVAPSNGFGGYQVTFPKGRVDQGTSLQATAIKEVWEESGLRVRLVAYLGDFARTQTYARFYVAHRIGGHPCDMGWESQAVHLATVAEAYRLLNRSTDRQVLDAFVAFTGKMPPSLHDASAVPGPAA
jgi:ADP-ribose pyrophosphatase YjhB (NUDIX family)